MSTFTRTITLADQQDAWLRREIEAGRYVDDSEAVRDLIRREQARSAELDELRLALMAGEQSGAPEPFDIADFVQRKAASHA